MSAELALADDWPQPFHDAGHTNRNEDAGFTAADLQELREVRTIEMPGEITGFVVADGAAFVTWAVRSSGLVVGGGVARIGLDGVPVWSRETSCQLSEPAVVAGSLLYRRSQTSTCPGPPFPPIVAVDAATGKDQRWHAPLWWYLPAVDRVFAATAIVDDHDGDMQTSLRSVDPVTGERSWNIPIDPPNPTHTYPVADGGSLFVRRYFHGIQALDAETGEEAWSWDLVSGSPRPLAVAHGRLFTELRYVGDGTVRLRATETSTGDELWTRRLDPNYESSPNEVRPLSVSPRAVVVPQARSVLAFDPESGARLWRRDISSPGITGAGRFVFVSGTRPNGSRTMIVLAASTGRPIARLDPVTGYVIVAADRLLWAEDDEIYVWR